MAVRYLSPEGLTQPTPYHHVAVGTGSRHVHVAGQIARLADVTPVAPGDLAGQVAHALRNVATGLAGLAGADATFADVLRLTFYVTAGRRRRWIPHLRKHLVRPARQILRRPTLVGYHRLAQ